MKKSAPAIAIVVPCYNEQEALPRTNRILLSLLQRMVREEFVAPRSFILYVADGSRDQTWKLIKEYSQLTPEIQGISLSSNAGHQNALIAGMAEVVNEVDAAITIDADLQDNPDTIPAMIDKFREGYEIVMGVRSDRSCDSRFKRATAQRFYSLQHQLGVKTVYDHADFRLMSRRAIEAFLEYGERNIFIRGVVASLGFKQATVEYTRVPRREGVSKYPLMKMINFAVDGITSFSVRPVRMIFFIGVGFLLVALGIFIYTMIRYFGGHTIEGWPSMILSIWFCSGILLLCMGIVGEYLGKIYTEVKHRHRYHVTERIGTEEAIMVDEAENFKNVNAEGDE